VVVSLLRLVLPVAVIVAPACNSVEVPPGPPVNACPENPCTAFRQSGPQPSCTSGLCLVTASVPGLALVVTLPATSAFAPGSTVSVLYNDLLENPTATLLDAGRPAAALPDFGAVQGAYLIEAAPTLAVGFPLGNSPRMRTALPAGATYRRLWPQANGTLVPVETLGLPIEPVQATLIEAPSNSAPGPNGGPSVAFQAYLQPGPYELVLRPQPPFDSIFGPKVTEVSVDAGPATDPEIVANFDVTHETSQVATIPEFDISRAAGLDGWKAYLRDTSSRLIVSNVAPLVGTAAHVVLSTSHVPPMVDALTGTALVIEPPSGQPFPTGVFEPIGNVLPAAETYPALPAPVTVQGSITQADSLAPVPADIVFEAQAIYDENGLLNTTNFELVAQAQARPSPPLGASTYSIELPQGIYRVSVRPLDHTNQLTVISADGGTRDVVVGALRTVTGRAVVADGRPLLGATVEAVGVACAEGQSPFCLPRLQTTLTASDGSFQLALDPGQYVFGVHPAEGTRLPWVVQHLSVGDADPPAALPTIHVPAPVSAGLALFDPTGRPIAKALVRVFSIPASGPAIEVGRSVTQDDGHFDMYIQPPAP
jgi:hypothetical protein